MQWIATGFPAETVVGADEQKLCSTDNRAELAYYQTVVIDEIVIQHIIF